MKDILFGFFYIYYIAIKILGFLFASIDLYIFKSLKYGEDWSVYILTENSIILKIGFYHGY